MKLRKLYETEYTRIQVIEPFPDQPNTTITVAQSQELLGDDWKPADINWPGCGSRNWGDAILFAEAIKYAAELARIWNQERVK